MKRENASKSPSAIERNRASTELGVGIVSEVSAGVGARVWACDPVGVRAGAGVPAAGWVGVWAQPEARARAATSGRRAFFIQQSLPQIPGAPLAEPPSPRVTSVPPGDPRPLQNEAKSCQDRASRTANEIMNTQLKKKMADIGAKTKVCFRVVFADGSSWQNHERSPDVTIFIRNSRAAWRVLLFGHVGFLEAYFNGDIDVEGNFPLMFRA